MYRNVSFCNTSHKISQNIQGTCNYIVNLWIFSVCSMIRYWHCVIFATNRQITIRALKQNGTNMHYLVIWYPVKNPLHLYEAYLPNLWKTRPKLEVKLFIQLKQIFVSVHDNTVSHIVRPFCCSAQIVIRHATGRKFCMMPVTNYWVHT